MLVSKSVVLAGVAGAAAEFSTTALAQMSQSKSRHLGELGHDEMMRVNPRTGTIQKSNIKISSAMHDAASSSGARSRALVCFMSTAAICTCSTARPQQTTKPLSILNRNGTTNRCWASNAGQLGQRLAWRVKFGWRLYNPLTRNWSRRFSPNQTGIPIPD